MLITERRVKETKNRLCRTMIHNPIYDGNGASPFYESVKPLSEDLLKVRSDDPSMTDISSKRVPFDLPSPSYSVLRDKSTLMVPKFIQLSMCLYCMFLFTIHIFSFHSNSCSGNSNMNVFRVNRISGYSTPFNMDITL